MHERDGSGSNGNMDSSKAEARSEHLMGEIDNAFHELTDVFADTPDNDRLTIPPSNPLTGRTVSSKWQFRKPRESRTQMEVWRSLSEGARNESLETHSRFVRAQRISMCVTLGIISFLMICILFLTLAL